MEPILRVIGLAKRFGPVEIRRSVLPVPGLFFLALIGTFIAMLRATTFGRYAYAIGGNTPRCSPPAPSAGPRAASDDGDDRTGEPRSDDEAAAPPTDWIDGAAAPAEFARRLLARVPQEPRREPQDLAGQRFAAAEHEFLAATQQRREAHELGPA